MRSFTDAYLNGTPITPARSSRSSTNPPGVATGNLRKRLLRSDGQARGLWQHPGGLISRWQGWGSNSICLAEARSNSKEKENTRQ